MNRNHMDLLFAGKPLPQQKPKAPSKPKKVVATVPTEHEEQVLFHKWLNAMHVPHCAIPNANALSFANREAAIRIMAKLKAEGFSPGFPDLVIFLPNKLLIIEMKRTKGGTASDEQKEWIETINSYGYCVGYICKGFEEAKKVVLECLEE